MADTYGVALGAVAAELPRLFPVGFTAGTAPTDAQVASLITTADTIIALHVRNCVGQIPTAADAAAPLAVRFIIEWVKAQVMRIVYAGNDPAQVAAAAAPYAASAAETKDAITAMGTQAEGEGDPSPRIQVPSTTCERGLLVRDHDLDGRHVPFRERRF